MAALHASLPMYNLPEMQADNAAFWQAIRTEAACLGVMDLPATIEFTRKPVPVRIESEAVFTQVCGWPLQTIYAGQATVLGVPAYAAPYCDGPTHAGVFMVRRDASFRSVAELRGCAFVFNSVHSNSGMNLPRRVIADLADDGAFFGSITETHSQPFNLERVARGEADATCVDCVTYAFFARHRPALANRLRVLDVTPPTPAIPFVTAVDTDAATKIVLAEALHRVASEPAWADIRSRMMLRDIRPPGEANYQVPCRYAAEAIALGYPALR
jgi:ABC-type phosphate/phosphonate transport system substrate-binding protein